MIIYNHSIQNYIRKSYCEVKGQKKYGLRFKILEQWSLP